MLLLFYYSTTRCIIIQRTPYFITQFWALYIYPIIQSRPYQPCLSSVFDVADWPGGLTYPWRLWQCRWCHYLVRLLCFWRPSALSRLLSDHFLNQWCCSCLPVLLSFLFVVRLRLVYDALCVRTGCQESWGSLYWTCTQESCTESFITALTPQTALQDRSEFTEHDFS